MANCETCYYYGPNSMGSCDYYLLTGERRGSPVKWTQPVTRCARYKPKSEGPQRGLFRLTGSTVTHGNARYEALAKARHRKNQILRPLYDQGLSDRKIAAEVRCSATAVRQWRLREGLPAQSQRKKVDA